MQEIRDALRILEAELYIGRVAWHLLPERRISRSMLQYVAFPEQSTYDRMKSIERILKHCFAWYGPLLIDDIIRITRLSYEDVEIALRNLEGTITRRELFANEFMYYGFADDFAQLTKAQPQRNFALIHTYDPIYTTQGGELFNVGYSQYLTLQIMQDGLTSGYLEYRLKGYDAVQIINIHISTERASASEFLEQLATAIQRVFAEMFMVRFIFIDEVRSQALNADALKLFVAVFQKFNFQLQNDYLVGGTRVHTGFTRDQVITAKLITYLEQRSRQRTIPELAEQLGKFTLNQLRNFSQQREGVIVSALQMLILQEKLFYMHRYFYTRNFLANIEPAGEASKITEQVLALEEISIGSVRTLGVDAPELLLSQLEAEFRICVANPFERQAEKKRWRSIPTNTPSMNYLQEHIGTTISLFGPLTFSELQKYYASAQQLNQSILLLRLAELMQSSNFHSVVVEGEGFYLSTDTLDILKHPIKNIQEWVMLHKEEALIENIVAHSPLYFSTANRVVFHKGQLCAVLRTATDADSLIIENITIANKQNNSMLLNLLRYIEQTFFMQGYNEIHIASIFGNSPQFWLQLEEVSK